ncbi:DUF1269 domain-containing protein [Lignipirellula cremea]|uniref:DUF1269 domain-containing protein n=1 Tax=Lignipirellula cremea TaxID=2528010 RepID=A0A518DRG5_9BACT|nr:DUF1269 domain-containing protein [Lignipirellula cremea]QDU94429.1 hypothetical protein Pla8534_22190 [Lignipirellula cremea]
MSGQCVVAVFPNLAAAVKGVRIVEDAGVPHHCVSLVQRDVSKEAAHPEDMQHGDMAENRAAEGAGLGGLLGLLLGAPLLMIPGVGLVLAAGPIAAGLTGAMVGGFLGSMSGWGVPDNHIAEYEEQVREGSVLVIIDSNPEELARAANLLQESEATAIDTHVETSADKVSP